MTRFVTGFLGNQLDRGNSEFEPILKRVGPEFKRTRADSAPDDHYRYVSKYEVPTSEMDCTICRVGI